MRCIHYKFQQIIDILPMKASVGDVVTQSPRHQCDADSNSTLPPAAAVLIVTVCSAQKR